MARKARPFEDRFWEKVDKSGDCWLWRGNYGIRSGGRKSHSTTPPRWMVILCGWETLESLGRKQVIRTCGNDRCVKPEHLKVVPNAKRGRMHHKTHLTEEDVVRMRLDREEGVGLKELARKYGVSVPTACKIVRREAWTHVE